MDRQKTIDRIKKLIALSKNNNNENERLSAFNKAIELLNKYNLTMADINGIVKPKITIPKVYSNVTKEYIYTKPSTPFFETLVGMLLLLALKGLFGTPVGWFVCYMIVVSFIK